jgi:hypothetical protein
VSFAKLQEKNIHNDINRGSTMGRRDFKQREAKKPKKDAKKKSVSISFEQPVEVEVIRKGKKPTEEEEE